MRTLIYVHEPSSITIQATDPKEADVLLCRYDRGTEQMRTGTQQFGRGLYLIVSRGELTISGGNVTVELLRGDKDVPPEPKARLIASASGVSAESINQFLEVAKGITVGDSPPAPASTAAGTSKITNEPDGI